MTHTILLLCTTFLWILHPPGCLSLLWFDTIKHASVVMLRNINRLIRARQIGCHGWRKQAFLWPKSAAITVAAATLLTFCGVGAPRVHVVVYECSWVWDRNIFGSVLCQWLVCGRSHPFGNCPPRTRQLADWPVKNVPFALRAYMSPFQKYVNTPLT